MMSVGGRNGCGGCVEGVSPSGVALLAGGGVDLRGELALAGPGRLEVVGQLSQMPTPEPATNATPSAVRSSEVGRG